MSASGRGPEVTAPGATGRAGAPAGATAGGGGPGECGFGEGWGEPLHLPVDGPLAHRVLLAMLRAHDVPGAQLTDETTHRRVLRLGGRLVAVAVEPRPDGVVLRTAGAPAEELAGVVRRWFELDADQQARNHHVVADPVLGPLVEATPGLRLMSNPDPFEQALGTVVGQQVSVAAARTMTGRIAAAWGTPGPAGLLALPRADELAVVPPDELRAHCGFMASRAHTLHALARSVADGLVLDPDGDAAQREQTRRELLALPGIGQWTVDLVMVRALRDPDVFPSGDLVLRRAMAVDDPRRAAARAEAWRPWRSFAATHLWAAAAHLP